MFWRKINFWEYWPNHGLIVVDMQSEFLKRSDPTMKLHVRRLIRKIGFHVEQCIVSWGEVVFIEFVNNWETVPHIKNAVERWVQKARIWDPGSMHTLEKRDNGLLEDNYDNAWYLLKNTRFFSHRKWKMFTIGWVNAYYCVSKCAKNLDQIGCKVRIDVGLTLNANWEIWEQNIRELDCPKRIIHSPWIHPDFLPIFRGKTFLEYL